MAAPTAIKQEMLGEDASKTELSLLSVLACVPHTHKKMFKDKQKGIAGILKLCVCEGRRLCLKVTWKLGMLDMVPL